MSTKNTNKLNVPQARAAMDKFKMEAASEVGVNLKEGYNGDLTSREAGSVGGQMVKKMIESYEKNLYPYMHNSGRLQSRPLLCSLSKKALPNEASHRILRIVNNDTLKTANPKGSRSSSDMGMGRRGPVRMTV